MIISEGVLLRSAVSACALYAGTVLISTVIAMGNVLLPGMIKRGLSTRMASMTGAYSITMGAAGAVGSAVIIPLTQSWEWPIALILLVATPLLALVVWLPQLKKRQPVNLSGPKQASTVAVYYPAQNVFLGHGTDSGPAGFAGNVRCETGGEAIGRHHL